MKICAGPGAEREARPWSPADRISLLLLGAGLLASLPLLVHPWYVPSGEASLYIATARSIAAGEGYSYLGQPFTVRAVPGFSALLAPVIALRGIDFHAMNLLVAGFGAAATLWLYVLARPRLGWLLASLAALALWFNPGMQQLCTQVLSDVPGTALLLLALCVERWARARPSRGRELVLTLAIAAASAVRQINLLLLPAIALSRVWSYAARGKRLPWSSFVAQRIVPFAAGVLLLLAPWYVHNASLQPEGAVDQTRLHSYATAMWRADPGDPDSRALGAGEILSRVPLRTLQIAEVLGSRLQERAKGQRLPGSAERGLHGVLAALLLCCAGLVMLRTREPAEIYLLLSVALLLVYFGFGDRLLLPVFALSIPAAVEVLRDGLARRLGPRVGIAGAAVALLAVIVTDLSPRQGWGEIERRHRAFVDLASALEEELQPDARLGSALGFNYGVYLERPVWSIYPFMARNADPGASAEAVIDRYDLDAIVLWPEVPRERAIIPYFRDRYGEGQRIGPATLWHVRRRAGAHE